MLFELMQVCLFNAVIDMTVEKCDMLDCSTSVRIDQGMDSSPGSFLIMVAGDTCFVWHN